VGGLFEGVVPAGCGAGAAEDGDGVGDGGGVEGPPVEVAGGAPVEGGGVQQRPEHCFGLALPEVAAVDGAGHAGAGGQRPGPDHRGLGQFTAADGGPAQAAGDVGCELLGVEHGDRAGGVAGLKGDGEVVGAGGGGDDRAGGVQDHRDHQVEALA